MSVDTFHTIDSRDSRSVHQTGRLDEERFAKISNELGQRLDNLSQTTPIPFRQQNAGEYHIPALTLREEIAPNKSGFSIHRKE